MPGFSGWQVRRSKGRRIYTGLSRAQIERALRTGKLAPDDFAMPPGMDRWMKVTVALIHSGEEVAAAPVSAIASSAEWAPMQKEGRLIKPQLDEEDPSEMDMTPMIDVTTLLLIFFLVGGVFMLQAAIDLPKARTGTPEVATEIKPVGILVDVDPSEPLGGTISFEDKRTESVALDDLSQRFKDKLVEGAANVTYRNEAMIKAHRDVPFGLVRQIMAKLTEAGVARIAVGIEEPREPRRVEPSGQEQAP